jgi:hypothetical protein
MPSTTATVIAIDGRPASPAMAAALEATDRNCREAGERKATMQARLDTDRRLIIRRAAKEALTTEYGHGVVGAQQVFTDMSSGRMARRSAIASLIRARVALIKGYRAEARQYIRDAIFTRRSHWTNHEAMTAPVVAGAVRLSEVAA